MRNHNTVTICDNTIISDLIEELNDMLDFDIIYRGFRYNKKSYDVLLIDNRERKEFRGMDLKNAIQIKNTLNIKNIVFGTRLKSISKIFGITYILIPKGIKIAYQSSKIKDLVSNSLENSKLSEYELEEIKKSYEVTLKNINKQEIIFDCEYYYLLNENYINQGQSIDNIKTYSDLKKILLNII
jgi:hypothetical protein